MDNDEFTIRRKMHAMGVVQRRTGHSLTYE